MLQDWDSVFRLSSLEQDRAKGLKQDPFSRQGFNDLTQLTNGLGKITAFGRAHRAVELNLSIHDWSKID